MKHVYYFCAFMACSANSVAILVANMEDILRRLDQIVKARASLTHELNSRSNPQPKKEGSSNTFFSLFQQEYVPLETSTTQPAAPLSVNVEPETHLIASEDVQIVDKSVIQVEARTETKSAIITRLLRVLLKTKITMMHIFRKRKETTNYKAHLTNFLNIPKCNTDPKKTKPKHTRNSSEKNARRNARAAILLVFTIANITQLLYILASTRVNAKVDHNK